MAADTSNTTDPRRSHPDHIVVDDDAIQIIEAAVYQLSICRSPMGLGDGVLRLHTLATLIAGAGALLPDAVADARDQHHTWTDIAGPLGITAGNARRRYNRHHRTRTTPIDLD